MPPKLHYGSRTSEKSQKVTRKSISKPSSSRTTKAHRNEYKWKNHTYTMEDYVMCYNDKIKTHAISSKPLEEHDEQAISTR